MKDGPVIATVAALIGDPARANMLSALMDGRALTMSELSQAAGVMLSTGSSHLTKLQQARLVESEKQGRHRYFRLAGSDVAAVLEQLMDLAQRTGHHRVRTGPRDEAMRRARVCYDHVAGEIGVSLFKCLMSRKYLAMPEGEMVVARRGREFLERFGISVAALESGRRPVCRTCLDWSERQHHLGGALGAVLLDNFLDRGWMNRAGGRVLTVTPAGRVGLRRHLQLMV